MVYEYGYMGMYSIQLTPWNIMIPFKYYVLGLAFKYQSEQERMNIHDEQWGIETCHHRIPGYIRIDLFVQCFLLLYFYKNDALRNIFDVINFTFFIINQHDHFKQCRTIAQVYIYVISNMLRFRKKSYLLSNWSMAPSWNLTILLDYLFVWHFNLTIVLLFCPVGCTIVW